MDAFNFQQLKEGDPDEWERAFIRLWGPAITAAKYCLFAELSNDAQDVAQETLIYLHENRDQLLRNIQSPGHLAKLTAAIARYKAINLIKRHRAEKRGGGKGTSLEGLKENNPGLDFPQDEAAASNLDTGDLEALATLLEDLGQLLGPRGLEILRGRYIEGLSHQEIAEKHRLNVKSVGIIIQRLLDKTRKALDKNPKLKKLWEDYK